MTSVLLNTLSVFEEQLRATARDIIDLRTMK